MLTMLHRLAIASLVLATSAATAPAARADHDPGTAAPWDFNGDGFGDPVMAAPDGDGGGGFVIELAGTRAGVSADTSRVWRSHKLREDGRVAGSTDLGRALASADFDSDGYADLAMSTLLGETPWPGVGAIWVLYGSRTGLVKRDMLLIRPNHQGLPDEYGLGIDLATGDVDGDDYPDLISGAIRLPFPDSGDREAAVAVFPGGARGLGAGHLAWTDRHYYGAFMAIAAGDVDRDGLTDVGVGLDGRDPGGTLTMVYGTADRGFAERIETWSQDSPGIPDSGTGRREADEFGTALAMGDFDGDGFADVAVGAPAEDLGDNQPCGRDGWGDAIAPSGFCDQGIVHLVRGSARGLVAGGDQILSQSTPGVPGTAQASDRFGGVMAVGDLDGDGIDDLAVGTPGEAAGAGQPNDMTGAVTVLLGGRGAFGSRGTQRWTQDAPGVLGPAAPGDEFGAALGALDVDGDGRDELVVGVPGDRVRGGNDAGLVVVLPGSESGLMGVGSTVWSLATPDVPGGASRDERFGSAVGG